jgi:hypothetical protein
LTFIIDIDAIFSNHYRRPFCAAANRSMLNKPAEAGTKKHGYAKWQNMAFIGKGGNPTLPAVLAGREQGKKG